MITLDLWNGDSILVEENLEKKHDISPEGKKKDFFLSHELNLQLITYHCPE